MRHFIVAASLAICGWGTLFAAGSAESGDRVTHYAFLSTGPSGGGNLLGAYWQVNQRMFEVLKEYGYPDEAIYRFSEYGATQGPHVMGRSTLANFRKTFAHLAEILKPGDHVFIMIVGHGSPSGGDFVHSLIGGGLSATELKEMIGKLPATDLTIVVHPCYSGGFLPKLSAPGRVVVSSTNDREVNACPWAEAFVEALALKGKTESRGASMKEAYRAALEPGRKKYGADLKEHPLLDDNGDGMGHFGAEPVVEGDGKLAAERFLGAHGNALHFSADAIAKLKALNAPLGSGDAQKFQRIFTAESVSLGTLGGYERDVGANSTRSDLHQAFAERNPPQRVTENLLTKYRLQFDRQAGLGKDAADKFYAESSARLAGYGMKLGDAGANRTDMESHLKWAQQQTVQNLRESLETKVRTVMAGALDLPN